jgi:hypothetical protein
MWGATSLSGSKADDGQTYYLGTLILEVPANADGTYTIEFLPDVAKTYMVDEYGQKIVPLVFTPALITINQLPNAPTIDGQTSGSAGTSYTYTFTSTDPDGDNIAEYIVNWGEGPDEIITGPFASGSPATASHIWSTQGNYVITAKAKDVNGLVGPEGTLSVSMPRNKLVNTPFLNYLQNFLQQYPILYQFLQRLLRL